MVHTLTGQTPNCDQYCVSRQGSRLHFTLSEANSVQYLSLVPPLSERSSDLPFTTFHTRQSNSLMRFFIFAAIFWTWFGSVLASSELCDSFETKRYLTAQEVKDELGPWFRTQFDEWKSEHAAAEPRFWSWFHQKYSPGMTDSILSCKLSGTCSVSNFQFCFRS